MKEIDFISSLFAMCKTRFVNLRYNSSVLAECFFERKHYPSRGTSLQNTTHKLWFFSLRLNGQKVFFLTPCMLLGSSSKVNTLSLELHQPTESLFLLKHQSRTFASDFSNLIESHVGVTEIFFQWSTKSEP